MKRTLHILLLMVIAAVAISLNPGFAQARTSVPEVRLQVRLVQPASVDPCDIVIESVNGAPLPAKTALRVASNTEEEFGPLPLTEPGTYTYKVYLKAGDAKGVIYDKTVYTVHVSLVYDGQGKLVSEVIAQADGGSEKGEIVFKNTLKETPPSRKYTEKPPQTGDAANNLWIVMAVASLGCIGLSRLYGTDN